MFSIISCIKIEFSAFDANSFITYDELVRKSNQQI